MNNIGQEPSGLDRYSGGVGYLIIPPYFNREDYILDCLKNNWVSILIEQESIKDRVICTEQVMNQLYFPSKSGELGTVLIWMNDPLKGQLYCIGSLKGPGDYEHNTENSFSIIRKYGNSFVEITGNSEKKYLNLTINSTEKSVMSINCIGSKDSLFELNVKGQININSDSLVNLKSKGLTSLITGNKKNSLDLTKEKFYINSELIVNEGKESFVLGDKLKEFLSSLLDELSKTQVVTPAGTYPISNSANLLALKTKLKSFLSSKHFLDK